MANRYFEAEEHAKLYQRFRLNTPMTVVEGVVEYLKQKFAGDLDVAVDVGCGTGQNTGCYSTHFKKVIGIDVSPAQIAVANQFNDKSNVSFQVSPAEKTNFADNSVQLVTTRSAIHWFDIPKFFKEVSRILCPGGVLAVYAGQLGLLTWEKDPSKAETFSQITHEFINSLREEHKKTSKEFTFNDYKDIVIPMDDFVRDEETYFMKYKISLSDEIKRVQTVSGFQLMRKRLGDDAAQDFLNRYEAQMFDVIKEDLGEEDDKSPSNIYFTETNPIVLLMARKPLEG